jgi:hypothetical protein
MARQDGAVEPTPQADDRPAPAPSRSPSPEAEPDDPVRCRTCAHVVTHRAAAIEVADAHERTFRNPGGWSFRVACYRTAPGCAPSGDPTVDHTWYAGYAWQLLHCGGCGGHLGWWYAAEGAAQGDGAASPAHDGFAGLITSRLRG